ncbi:hypothetical protein L2E82_50055 [Cichorium intybus]|nr:hypothetical protein L2E82_50055 [Cichorium intybus]
MPEITRTRTSPLPAVPTHMSIEKVECSLLLEDNPQTAGRVLTYKNDDVTEDLMQDHELFLSTLRSRVTKLQVVRNFWERNDTRAAINALQKLPDYAVQANVISVMPENMDSLNLDLFSCLLRLLLSLLDSQIERHINVSLQMLLNLVAVFGPVITFTISAPSTVSVDIHAEKRLYDELSKVQSPKSKSTILPKDEDPSLVNNDQDKSDQGTENGDQPVKSKRKRGIEDEDVKENGHESDDPFAQKKPGVVWSIDLHRKFVAAVNQLGIEKAVPKRILDLMNVDGITRENVASHLQVI